MKNLLGVIIFWILIIHNGFSQTQVPGKTPQLYAQKKEAALAQMSSTRGGSSTSDCGGSVVLCGGIYTEETAPPGTGSVYEFTGTCNQGTETMSLWYTFTVAEAGIISFIIDPAVDTDDYDWGLFNITNGGCAGIIAQDGSSPEVGCNSYGSLVVGNGPTGISTANGGVGTSNGPGDTFGPAFNADLQVNSGQTFALVVMNWSNSTNGYTIDFTQSTANIYDASVPVLTASAEFSELCADAAFPVALTGTPDGGSFSGTNVTDSNFDPSLLPAGIYTITYNYTTTAGCDAVPATTSITINPLPVVTIEGLDISYCLNSEGAIPTLSPIGGTLSGLGLFENSFIPAIAGIGQHQIEYSYADSNGCGNTASVNINVEECLSIDDANKLGIEILPNPFHGSFTVRFVENENSINTLEVYSINGQKLKSISIENSKSNQQVEIDLSNQAAGIYFLHLKGSAKENVVKLVHE